MAATQWQTCVGVSTRVEHSSHDGHSSIHDAVYGNTRRTRVDASTPVEYSSCCWHSFPSVCRVTSVCCTLAVALHYNMSAAVAKYFSRAKIATLSRNIIYEVLGAARANSLLRDLCRGEYQPFFQRDD